MRSDRDKTLRAISKRAALFHGSFQNKQRLPQQQRMLGENGGTATSVICFIAGGIENAITVPEMWQKLHAEAGGGIGFALYTDSSCGPVHEAEWWKSYCCKLGKLGVWGNFSLTKIEVEMYRWALKTYKQANWFFLVRHVAIGMCMIHMPIACHYNGFLFRSAVTACLASMHNLF